MSDEQTNETAELESVVVNDGMLTVDLAGLPPGSLVTITVRVGPEQPEPSAEPEPKVKSYAGARINHKGAA